jgi:putative phosphoesterase
VFKGKLMMLALISDIHANMHALEAVWEDLQREGPDAVYCLGDLVGYGAFPNEVVEFIKKHDVPTVMGNYDEGVGFDLHDCGCVYKDPEMDRLGKESLLWTRKRTTAGNKAFLQSLPIQIRVEDRTPSLLMVHGSPRKINEYLYEHRPEATFVRISRAAGTDVVLFGHTHLAYQKAVNNTLFVNTGSVGKPKDGDPRAGYVLLSLSGETSVEFRRVSYDVGAAADAIRAAGLPEYFAAELITGGSPPFDRIGSFLKETG